MAGWGGPPPAVATGLSLDDVEATAEELLQLLGMHLADGQPGLVVWDGPKNGLLFLGWDLS